MIGVYDFCGHYDWTFEWLRKRGGEPLLREYWNEAIHKDSQQHAAALIKEKGFQGMLDYWGRTLDHEGAAYHTTLEEDVFRIDMHACPSKGFLIRNNIGQYHDYCDHCMGWIGPMLKQAGFVVDHEHNHRGQCWWEIRRASSPGRQSSQTSPSTHDVRLSNDWNPPGCKRDAYRSANSPDDKLT